MNTTVKSDYKVYMVGKVISMFHLIIWKLKYLGHWKKAMKGPDKNANHGEERIFFEKF